VELFTEPIKALRSFIDEMDSKKSWQEDRYRVWPEGGGRNIVLKEDMGLELGSPEKESLSCILWTEHCPNVADGTITLIGPDFSESMGKSLPFGKVVLVGVEGFTEDNAYDRHRAMDLIRYSLDLKGFMMRAASQYMREWCRISRSTVMEGFTIKVLGSALMALFRREPFVKAVELIYVTSNTSDVNMLKQITAPAEKIISAMNKMIGEMDYDCDKCDYQTVCDDASQLKSMREAMIKKSRESRAVKSG
jgi:CO dehydrogenase/acetyl-CoA synthase beta subunit